MLTPANVFILGFVEHDPINPYEIIKRFEYHMMKDFLKMSDSAIYANMRSLYKKKLLDYEWQQEGKMPQKKVYFITSKGIKELEQSIRYYLSTFNLNASGFTVSLLFMSRFSKEELLGLLRERVLALEKVETAKKREYENVLKMNEEKECIPFIAGAAHIFYSVQQECNTTKYIVELLKKTNVWPQNTMDIFASDYTLLTKNS